MNIISHCDGGLMHVCCMCNPLVNCEANLLSQAAGVWFRLVLTEIITGKVSIGCLLVRALNASIGYLLSRALKVSI